MKRLFWYLYRKATQLFNIKKYTIKTVYSDSQINKIHYSPDKVSISHKELSTDDWDISITQSERGYDADEPALKFKKNRLHIIIKDKNNRRKGFTCPIPRSVFIKMMREYIDGNY